MPDSPNSQIMRMLGELSSDVKGIRREMDTAAENRKNMYQALEQQRHITTGLEFRVDTAVQTSAQAREEIKALHNSLSTLAELQEDLPKMVASWKEIRSTSRKLFWLLSIGGVATLGTLVWLGEQVKNLVLIWLGLGPPPA